jgi:hypothetical protein
VLGSELRQLGVDTEQFGDEILQMGRHLEEERGLLFASKAIRTIASGEQPLVQG